MLYQFRILNLVSPDIQPHYFFLYDFYAQNSLLLVNKMSANENLDMIIYHYQFQKKRMGQNSYKKEGKVYSFLQNENFILKKSSKQRVAPFRHRGEYFHSKSVCVAGLRLRCLYSSEQHLGTVSDFRLPQQQRYIRLVDRSNMVQSLTILFS